MNRRCTALVSALIGHAACGKPSTATTQPTKPATAIASCSERPTDQPALGSRASLVIQASGLISMAVAQFSVELVKNGTTVCRTSTREHQPHVVEIDGLTVGEPIEIVVSAPDYLAQRRRVIPHARGELVYLYLAAPGMRFFHVGGTPIPYAPARARVVVMSWNRDGSARFVPASLPSKRDDRRRAIRVLRRELQLHPERGQLVVLLDDRARLFFTGELILTCPQGCDQNELAKLAATHDLEVVDTVGGRVTVRMNVPDVDFAELAEQIRKDHPSVADVESHVDSPIEIDRGPRAAR